MDWKNNNLLTDLSEVELSEIEPMLDFKECEPGKIIIDETSSDENCYLILEGEVDIYKKENNLLLAHLSNGDSFGLMALLDKKARSATVKAKTKLKYAILSQHNLNQIKASSTDSIYHKILHNYIIEQSRSLRETNKLSMKLLNEKLANVENQIAFGHFFTSMLIILVIYAVALRYSMSLIDDPQTIVAITCGLLTIFTSIAFLHLKFSNMPLEYYGVGIGDWRAHLKQSLIWTGYFLLFLTLIKWIAIITVPALHDQPLLMYKYTELFHRYSPLFLIVYVLFTIIQEFITRCMFQSCLMNFFSDRYYNAEAIFLSSLAFSMLHLHQPSILFPVLVFIPGIFWGILYAKQRKLLGVCLSHTLIGIYAIYFLDIVTLFQTLSK